MAEYKSNKDLPKKQVQIYIYRDIERIIKGYGFKPSEFITLKALELLKDIDMPSDIKQITKDIEKEKEKKEKLLQEVSICDSNISELTSQLDNLKDVVNNFNINDSAIDSAVSEILGLARARTVNTERMPYIYFDDVLPICEKYGVNYMWVLSKVPKSLLNNHFKLRFKK